jgi:transposase
MERKPYPSDVSDDEWAFVAPYLTLMTEDAPQRGYRLREVFNGLHWIVRAGAAWRLMPHDVPPWHTVYQQSKRWLKAGVFETMGQPFSPGHFVPSITYREGLTTLPWQRQLVDLR